MSISGVVQLFVGKPVHPVGADGRMALSDHLRELRARLLKVALIIVVGLAVSLRVPRPALLVGLRALPAGPGCPARGQHRGRDQRCRAAGLLLYLKLSGFASVIGTSPLWLYQIWAFILPGLHPRERKWTRIFAAIAGPLFLAGVALGYVTLPKGLEILIGFNPDGVTNLVDFNEYLTFFSRTLIVFGIAFEIPLFVVLLNLAGVVSGKALGNSSGLDHRRHLHLRRDRHPVGRPLHDDVHGGADGGAVPGLRADRPVQRPSSGEEEQERRPVARRDLAPVTAP